MVSVSFILDCQPVLDELVVDPDAASELLLRRPFIGIDDSPGSATRRVFIINV
jgi:hypothetical protein